MDKVDSVVVVGTGVFSNDKRAKRQASVLAEQLNQMTQPGSEYATNHASGNLPGGAAVAFIVRVEDIAKAKRFVEKKIVPLYEHNGFDSVEVREVAWDINEVLGISSSSAAA